MAWGLILMALCSLLPQLASLGPLLCAKGHQERAATVPEVGRLRKANWDPVPFLDGDPHLCMACLEPDVLLYGGEAPSSEVPSLARESERELLALAHKWDEKGLLFPKKSYEDQVSPLDAVMVFNCYKDQSCDRQIGDRRSRNFRERALRGPSTCGPVVYWGS